jgi:hypothetical protein
MSHGHGSVAGHDAATVPIPTAISRTARMRASYQAAFGQQIGCGAPVRAGGGVDGN